MAKQVHPKRETVEIDLDALLAERQTNAPKTVRMFGAVHELVRPATPAGLLQILELQRTSVKRRMATDLMDTQLAGIQIAENRVKETVEIILLVLPSLEAFRDDLMRLDFSTLEAINEKIGLAELLDEGMRQIGATRSELPAEGEKGDVVDGETLEGNLPESSGN